MILLLDTSTSLCRVILISPDGERSEFSWDAGRQLSVGILSFIKDCLGSEQCTFEDLKGVGFFEGPGSFTGLRIGATVVNSLAGSLGIPLSGARGSGWVDQLLNNFRENEVSKVITPYYGAEAHITTPRK